MALAKPSNRFVQYRRQLAAESEAIEQADPDGNPHYADRVYPEWSLNPPPAVGLQALADLNDFFPAEHLRHETFRFIIGQNCQHLIETGTTIGDVLHSISIAYHAARQKARAAGLPVSD